MRRQNWRGEGGEDEGKGGGKVETRAKAENRESSDVKKRKEGGAKIRTSTAKGLRYFNFSWGRVRAIVI